MKRFLLDLGVVILFIAEYFCEQVTAGSAVSSAAFIIFNPMLMFVGVASLAAFIRGMAEQRAFVSTRSLWISTIEWMFLVLVSYILTCFFDVMRHPPENFLTVFGFNVFILLIPTLIVSTGVYVAARSFFRASRKDGSCA